MHALPCNFLLPLPDELVAHAGKNRHHNPVEKVMPLNIEICGLRCHAKPSEVVLKAVVALLGIWIGSPELLAPARHLAMQKRYYALCVVDVEVDGFYGVQKVAHGELAVMTCAVIPNVPNEQGVYGT